MASAMGVTSPGAEHCCRSLALLSTTLSSSALHALPRMYWDLNVAWPNNRTQQKRMLEMAITRQRCPHLHLHPITHSTHPHPLTPPSTLPLSLLPAVGYDGIVFTQTLHDKFTNKMVLHPPSPSHARTLSDLPPPTPPLSYPHLPSPPLSPPPPPPVHRGTR